MSAHYASVATTHNQGRTRFLIKWNMNPDLLLLVYGIQADVSSTGSTVLILNPKVRSPRDPCRDLDLDVFAECWQC